MLLAESDVSWSMAISLLGGLALFLFGMDYLTVALKVIAGERLRGLIHRLTANRFSGVLAGTIVTSVIQSSSVTTVLVVGFVSAGVMTLTQAIGVIMGASIGTTITAQLVAFKITSAASALIAVGFGVHFFAKREPWKRIGSMIFGIGTVFLGMNLMADATSPLRDYQPFIDAIQNLDSPLKGILLSALFTAIVQSSSATTVLLVVLAGEGLLTIEQAIPLVFGANIGTCVTALLASFGKSVDAIRAATVHILFNTAGVLIWFPFIRQLAWLVTELSPDTARQIAHSHTVFNITNTIIFIGFTSQIARFVTWLVPDRPAQPSDAATPKFLDEIVLQTPGLALDAIRRELGRLGTVSLLLVRSGLGVAVSGNESDFEHVKKLDDDVDSLHGAIVTYIARLSQQPLTAKQTRRSQDLLLIANYFENIGDLIETQLMLVGRQRANVGLKISPETTELINSVHREVTWAVDHAIRAVVDHDQDSAQLVTRAKPEFNLLIAKAEEHLSHRLTAAAPHRLIAYRLESEIMEHFKRVFYFARRIARLAVADETPAEDANTTPSAANVLTS